MLTQGQASTAQSFSARKMAIETHQNHQFNPAFKSFNTLGEVLAYWAKVQPDRQAYTMLDPSGMEEDSITYGDMYIRAISIAQKLLSDGLRSRHAVLLYPPGIEFIVGFFGCLFAGVAPAPIHPPKRKRSNQKIANLVRTTEAAAILLPAAQEQLFSDLLRPEENWPADLRYIATDGIAQLPPSEAVKLPELNSSEVAFLQFTSGSTSLPKGVMITHANCLSNLEMAVSVSRATPDSTFVSWLPHHHDLGLVAHLLHSLYSGSHCVILSPTAFVSQPIQWLQAITKYRGEYTGAPNFAYQLCVDKIQPDEQQAIDLSSLRMAINAAEPIDPQTLRDFSQKFAPNGFKPQMFLPAYGMAEATVFISSGTLEQEPVFKSVDWTKLGQDNIAQEAIDGAKEKVFVGCGQAKLDEQIRIVDPELDRIVPSNQVGEIWVSGSNIMAGYYNHPEASAKTLVYLTDDDRVYLRTGDLGFIDDRGELYITGRLKDMMIINGVNYYPQDLEGCVEQAHPDITSGCVAAFSVPGQTGEELVIFAELKKAGMTNIKQPGYLEQLAAAICSALGENFEIRLHELVFLKMGQLPKTSSGKLRRQQCKQDFLQGVPDALGRWTQDRSSQQPEEEVNTLNLEKTFAQIMSMGSTHLKIFTQLIRILIDKYEVQLVDFDLEKPLSIYGIDSSKLVEIHRTLEERLACRLPVELFCPTNNFKGMLDDLVCSLSNNN
jgi:acyl-CoA synthetase (AMP-forming)/AMP-acid ligase II/acyl carrier protein